MADPIKPTASDREAAAHMMAHVFITGKAHTDYTRLLDGRLDHHWSVQLIALHAQQAREQALEEAAKVLDDRADRLEEAYAHVRTIRPEKEKYRDEKAEADIARLREHATAIRALKEQPPC